MKIRHPCIFPSAFLLCWLITSPQWPLIESNIKSFFFYYCQFHTVAWYPPFISAFINPEWRKGGIFHKSLPPVAGWGMQTRWSKPEERRISALTVCWRSRLVHNMSSSSKISLRGPLLNCDCKAWSLPPCGNRCRQCRLLITVRTLRSVRARAESSAIGRHYVFFFFKYVLLYRSWTPEDIFVMMFSSRTRSVPGFGNIFENQNQEKKKSTSNKLQPN